MNASCFILCVVPFNHFHKLRLKSQLRKAVHLFLPFVNQQYIVSTFWTRKSLNRNKKWFTKKSRTQSLSFLDNHNENFPVLLAQWPCPMVGCRHQITSDSFQEECCCAHFGIQNLLIIPSYLKRTHAVFSVYIFTPKISIFIVSHMVIFLSWTNINRDHDFSGGPHFQASGTECPVSQSILIFEPFWTGYWD